MFTPANPPNPVKLPGQVAATDLADRIGGGICDAAADRLDAIIAENGLLAIDNFKFVSEAIIATARMATPRAVALNMRLGEALFSETLRSVLLKNPRSVAMYALPMTFLATPPPRAATILALFRRLHADRAVMALHYPDYRNREMDFIAARLAGARFYHDPFADLVTSLPWADRDLVYGITHVHFYNSNFGADRVAYPEPAAAMLEALIARAAHDGDGDVLLELLIVYANCVDADPETLACHDALAADTVMALCTPELGVEGDEQFAKHYHPLFVAAIYLATRGPAFAPKPSPSRAARRTSLGAVLAAAARGDMMAFLGDYASHCEQFGQEPAIEPALALYGDLIGAAVRDRNGAPTAGLAVQDRDMAAGLVEGTVKA